MQNSLDDALTAIQDRNKKVEIQKAWETSKTRRAFIAIVTYSTAYVYMTWGLDVPDAYLHAFVPTGGYLLSTFSLPIIKDLWIQRNFGQNL